MKNYDIYFEIYGKKLKTSVFAESESDAKQKIYNKIIFHKISVNNDDFIGQDTTAFDNIMNIFGYKK